MTYRIFRQSKNLRNGGTKRAQESRRRKCGVLLRQRRAETLRSIEVVVEEVRGTARPRAGRVVILKHVVTMLNGVRSRRNVPMLERISGIVKYVVLVERSLTGRCIEFTRLHGLLARAVFAPCRLFRRLFVLLLTLCRRRPCLIHLRSMTALPSISPRTHLISCRYGTHLCIDTSLPRCLEVRTFAVWLETLWTWIRSPHFEG